MSQNWTPPPAAGGTANVPNYLVPAIIFATQVNSKVAAGDLAGAEDASKKAKLFSFIAIGIGLLCYVVVGLIYGVAIIAAISGSSR